MLVITGDIGEIGQLRDPIDQLGDFFTEITTQIGQCHAGVFDRIVQQRSRDHDGRNAHLSQYCGDRHTVGDIGFSGGAFLTGMRFFRVVIGPLNIFLFNRSITIREGG